MPGGELLIEIADDGEVFMTGPVEGTFEGTFHEDLENRLEQPS
jgi:diaminopimelate epimerase